MSDVEALLTYFSYVALAFVAGLTTGVFYRMFKGE